MSHGLRKTDIQEIITAIEKFPEVEAIVIFGSRAKGNFKKASDIDLAVKGKSVTDITVKRLSSMLNEELSLPF